MLCKINFADDSVCVLFFMFMVMVSQIVYSREIKVFYFLNIPLRKDICARLENKEIKTYCVRSEEICLLRKTKIDGAPQW